MERWHLTLLVATGAVVGAAVAPPLGALRPALDRPADPPPREIGTEPRSEWASDGSAGLVLDARLDRYAALRHGDGELHVVVNVTAPEVPGERVPVDLALVIDTSGSMGQEGKLGQAQAAADALVEALRPGDRFALVTFDDRARVLAEGERFDGREDAARLHGIVRGLREDGGTNLWAGLTLGRGELDAFGEGAARKVLLVSDGNANVGETDPDAFADLARAYASAGATISAIGLGRDFNETLLEGMADGGGGTYRFVGEPEELPSVIAAELERTTRTFARSATVRVQAAEGVTIRDVYGWPTERVATPSGDAVEVDIGAIPAGQTRKIVLAVEAPTRGLGEAPVASASLAWETVDGATGEDHDAVYVRVTQDPYVVEASVDEEASVAAARARAGELARASADAWRRGDTLRARSMVQSAAVIIAEARAASDAPELREDAERIVELEAFGYVEGGSYAAKAASEAGRDLAR